MAKVTLKDFEAALRADKELRKRFEEALKGASEVANDGEAMVKATAELGYELSLEELEQAWASAQKLDQTELDAVTGGNRTKDGHWTTEDDWCFANYFCFTAWSHDEVEGEHYEACLADYHCVIVYHH